MSSINTSFKQSLITSPFRGGGGVQSINIREALFNASEPGVWFDPSDLTTAFNDVSGMFQAAMGQTVAFQLDKSQGQTLGPELVNLGAFPAPAIADFGGGVGVWNAGTRTMSNAIAGSNPGYPRFTFTLPGLVVGKYYRVVGQITQTAGAVSMVRSHSAGGYNVPFDTVTGVMNGYTRPLTTNRLEFHLNSTLAVPQTATITSLSIREVLGNHRYQDTAASRPTLGRMPDGGIRNVLLQTENFESPPWTSLAVTIAVDPANPGARLITNTAENNYHAIRQVGPISVDFYTRTILVKKPTVNGARYVTIGEASAPTATSNTTIFDLDTGTYTQIAASQIVLPVVALGNGWFRIGFSRENFNGNTNFFHVGISAVASGAGAAMQYVGAGQCVLVKNSQMELGRTATNHQRVGTAFDVTEQGRRDCHYLQYDGIDDWMETESVAFSTTDKITVVAGAERLNDAASGLLFETSASSSVANGSLGVFAPSGGLSFLVRNRGNALNSDVSVVGYLVPFRGVLTVQGDLGGDLVNLNVNRRLVGQKSSFVANAILNGAFATDLTNWILTQTAAAPLPVWDAGVMRLVSDGSGFCRADQSFPTEIGKLYTLTFNFGWVSPGSLQVNVGITQGANGLLNQSITSSGPQSYTFTATGTTTWLRFSMGSSNATGFTVDNVVITTPGTEGNYTNQKIYFGRRGGTQFPFNGREFHAIIRGAATPAETLKLTERFVMKKTNPDTVGPNLFVNGGFNTDVASWVTNAATIAWEASPGGGQALVTFTGSGARITQDVPRVINRTYRVRFKVRSGTTGPYVGDLAVQVSDVTIGIVTLTPVLTEYEFSYVSGATGNITMRFARNTAATGTLVFDDMTIREVF